MGGLFSSSRQQEESSEQEVAVSSRAPHRALAIIPDPTMEELLMDVSPEKLDRPCSERHLRRLAFSVTEWRSVAPFLGLTKSEEEAIEADSRGSLKTQRIEMLRRWKYKFGIRATYRRLAEVFLGVGQAGVVEALCRLLAPKSSLVLASYTNYLQERYQAQNPTFIALQWPPPPARKFFNVVLALQENIERGPTDEELTRLTPRGDVDDFLHRKTLVKVKDILKLDRAERKLILIEGAPGAGKSSLAWHVPQKWASGEYFQEFEVVVFLQLRDPDVHAAQSLADLLPAENKVVAENMACELRALRGKNVLFVLDGWDELPPELQLPSCIFQQLVYCPEKLNLDLSAVIITSRPIFSQALYRVVSSRVEIVGFTPTDRRRYFTEAVGKDMARVQKLRDHLRERPVINAGSYLPLNAAIVAHLFLALNQTLPNTLHEVFSSLVICVLIRHVQREANDVEQAPEFCTLEGLPDIIRQQFKNLCTLAYHGMMENRVTFSTSDLQSLDLTTELSTISLIQGVQCFTAFGETRSFNFLHLSIQELLAAFHISTLSESEQIRIFKELFGHPQFTAVIHYYAGFSKLQAKEIRDYLTNIVKRETDVCNSIHTEHDPLMYILHCVHEAQDPQLCQLMASQLRGNPNLVNRPLSTIRDCLAVGHFLHSMCLNTSEVFTVNLNNCLLDDNNVSFLVKELGKSTGPQYTYMAAADRVPVGYLDLCLSTNDLHRMETQGCAQLLNGCSLIKTLRVVPGDSFDDENGEDGLPHLLQTLTTNSNLVNLSLDDRCMTITKESGPLLTEMLQQNKSLKSLDLSHCEVSDLGVSYLAEGLKKNTELEKLSMRGMTEQGAQLLLDALAENRSFVSLNISENGTGEDQGAHHSLTITTTLEIAELDLNGWKLTDSRIKDLLAQVKKSFEASNTSDDLFSDGGASRIAEILRYHHRVTSEGRKQFVLSLQLDSHLITLKMCTKDMPRALERELMYELRRLRRFPELRYYSSKFDRYPFHPRELQDLSW